MLSAESGNVSTWSPCEQVFARLENKDRAHSHYQLFRVETSRHVGLRFNVTNSLFECIAHGMARCLELATITSLGPEASQYKLWWQTMLFVMQDCQGFLSKTMHSMMEMMKWRANARINSWIRIQFKNWTHANHRLLQLHSKPTKVHKRHLRNTLFPNTDAVSCDDKRHNVNHTMNSYVVLCCPTLRCTLPST